MVYVQYKYTPFMFVARKPVKKFLKDFIDKHFYDFYEGRIGLYISPVYESVANYIQLTFDLDNKRKGSAQVLKDATQLIKIFKIPFEFITTPNGLHACSQIAFKEDIPILEVNHLLKNKLAKKLPSIDWNGSIRITPFGRLGYTGKDEFYMNPVILDQRAIEQIKKLLPKELMSEDEWLQYFYKKLIPSFDNTTTVKDMLHDVFGFSEIS